MRRLQEAVGQRLAELSAKLLEQPKPRSGEAAAVEPQPGEPRPPSVSKVGFALGRATRGLIKRG
jgi:hypothetical protein